MDIYDFICPITKQLFNKPVLLNDGFFYEKDAINEWLINSDLSPMTGKQLNHKYYNECFLFNKLLKKMINENTELKKEQYVISINLNFINKTLDEIYVSLQENNISMCEININFNIITEIFTNDNLVKYLIDNTIEIKNNMNMKLIHYICRFSTPELIKYIIDKGANTECYTNEGWKPIHIICRNSTPELIKYIIDKGVDLECADIYGWKPIHIICRYSTPELIKYIIDKDVDLECSNNNGWKPIHFICRYSTSEMIKYIIDKGANTECSNNDGWKPIHFICRYSTPELIKYIIDKGVDLECSAINGWKPIHFICQYSIFESIKYIIDKGINKNEYINKFDGTDVNYNCIDLINKRSDIIKKMNIYHYLIYKSVLINKKLI